MNETNMNARFLCLSLFDGGAASAGGEGTGAVSGDTTGASADTGAENNSEQEAREVAKARREEFERLIGTDYKDVYAEKTQKLIDRRFKQTKLLEERDRQMQPILERLHSRYGVEDPVALLQAMDKEQAASSEQAAASSEQEDASGGTIRQRAQMQQMQQRKAALKREAAERQRRVEAQTVYDDWVRQADGVKRLYPSFDLRTECQDPEFLHLLRCNTSVKTAYEIRHQNEIMGGAMAYTARKAREAMVKDIRARGMRPTENGLASTAAAVVKKDVSKMTKAEREAIEKRALRGEKIVL